MKILDYQIVSTIYESQKTVVYLVKEKEDGISYVLKMSSQEFPDQKSIESIRKEYDILQSLSSSFTLRVKEIIETRQICAVVMQYGGVRLLQAVEGLSIHDKLALMVQIVGAVAEIHKAQLIHRDLNPMNILVGEDQRIKIIDFDLAIRNIRYQGAGVVLSEIPEGTLAYMAPEQTGRVNRAIDQRTDLYGLGGTFYHLLTGRPPFEVSDDRNKAIHYQIAKKPLEPHRINSDISDALSKIVMKLLEKNPEDRYQSAEGLLYDLELLRTGNYTESFPLGQQDIQKQFVLKRMFYGRENDMNVLNHFVLSHQKQRCLIVVGERGMGKTTLLKHFKQQLLNQNIKVYYGKYDLERHGEPFHGLMDILREILGDILSSSNEILSMWRDRFEDVLGSNAGALTSILPELKHVLGSSQPMSPLGLEEAKNRLFRILFEFIGIFADKRFPVVFCIDDADQMDPDSVEMFAQLLQSPIKEYSHFIFTSKNSEWLLKIESMKDIVQNHDLAALTIADVKDCLDDHHLRVSGNSDGHLEMFQITKGHPYTLYYLIRLMGDQNRIVYNEETQCFEMNLQNISAMELPEQIQVWIEHAIASLEPDVKELIQTAVILGKSFSEELLISSLALSEDQINAATYILEEKGFLTVNVQLLENYKYGKVYQFASDPIYDTVSGMNPDEHSQRVLAVARRLVEGLSENAFLRYQLMITDLFNSVDVFIENHEVEMLARYNFNSGLEVKRLSAYERAYGYFSKCHELLERLSILEIPEHYFSENLQLDLYMQLAENACVIAKYDQMNDWIEKAVNFEHVQAVDRQIHMIRIKAMIASGRREEAIDYALDIVRSLNVVLKRRPHNLDLLIEVAQLNVRLGKNPSERLKGLSKMVDENAITVMELLSLISSSAYLSCPELYVLISLRQVMLSLDYGDSDLSYNAYTLYAMILCGMFGKYEKGSNIAKIAMEKMNDCPDKRMEGRVFVHSGLFVSHFSESLDVAKAQCFRGYQSAIAHGDNEYAAWGLFVYSIYDFYSGRSLPLALNLIENASMQIRNIGQRTQMEFSEIFIKSIKRLLEPGLATQLNDEDHAYADYIQANHQSPDSSKFYLNLNHMLYFYLVGAYETAGKAADEANRVLESVISSASYPLFYALEGLISIELIYQSGRMERKKRLNKSYQWLKKWVVEREQERQHFILILDAQVCAYTKKDEKAIRYLNQAFEVSNIGGSIIEQAIISELATRYFYENQQKYIAKPFAKRAEALYKKWGFTAKVEQFTETYSELLVTSQSQYDDNTSQNTTMSGYRDLMDLSSITKAMQTIATEANEGNMIMAFMRILAENTGADRALLFIGNERHVEISAVWRLDSEAIFISSVHTGQAVPNGYEESFAYPKQIIHYVQRTQSELMLNDLEENHRFVQDIYLMTHQPKSMFCIPILLKNHLKGILYLENSLTSKAFRVSQNDLVRVLSTQLAIALENSRLISHLEDVVKERTTQLREISDQYKKLSVTDQLTGLYNRRELDHRIHFEYNRMHRYGGNLAIILMDLDHFKRVNDQFGHQVGDMTLITFSKLVRNHVREQDVFGRWGGEEFMLICPETDMKGAVALAEKIREMVTQAEFPEVKQLTTSIGVAAYREGDSLDELVRRADIALYTAKSTGRNRVIGS